jgi:hypothetical protein
MKKQKTTPVTAAMLETKPLPGYPFPVDEISIYKKVSWLPLISYNRLGIVVQINSRTNTTRVQLKPNFFKTYQPLFKEDQQAFLRFMGQVKATMVLLKYLDKVGVDLVGSEIEDAIGWSIHRLLARSLAVSQLKETYICRLHLQFPDGKTIVSTVSKSSKPALPASAAKKRR